MRRKVQVEINKPEARPNHSLLLQILAISSPEKLTGNSGLAIISICHVEEEGKRLKVIFFHTERLQTLTHISQHTSCMKPGRLSSAVRQPPPGFSAASNTVTSTPHAARHTAAVSPLGPDPMTVAFGEADTAAF